jgi:hypothetical protein
MRWLRFYRILPSIRWDRITERIFIGVPLMGVALKGVALKGVILKGVVLKGVRVMNVHLLEACLS